MSEPGRSENLGQSPEALSRANLAKSMDNFSGRMFKAGANILRLGVGTGVAAAEVLVPTSLWLPKIGAIVVGYGLDRLGRTNPNSKAAILAQKIGEGAWKGGAFGLASSLVLNTVIEPQARLAGVAIASTAPDIVKNSLANEQVLFTDRLVEGMKIVADNDKFNFDRLKVTDIRLNPLAGIQKLQTQISSAIPGLKP